MDIQLTCRHCELSDGIRDYVAKKTERVLRHFDGVHDVEMVFSAEGAKTKVEMIVGTVRSQRCVAVASHEDMFAAVDLVADKMDHQVKKLKSKLRERHGPPPRAPGSM